MYIYHLNKQKCIYFVMFLGYIIFFVFLFDFSMLLAAEKYKFFTIQYEVIKLKIKYQRHIRVHPPSWQTSPYILSLNLSLYHLYTCTYHCIYTLDGWIIFTGNVCLWLKNLLAATLQIFHEENAHTINLLLHYICFLILKKKKRNIF